MYNGMQNGTSGTKSDEDLLIIVFAPDKKENIARTLEAGVPQFDDIDTVTVIAPGERAPILGPIEATDKHKQKYPRAWAAYKEKRSQPIEGLPLEQWPLLSAARVAELKGLGIHTVEALTKVNDERLRHIGMGGRDLRQKAQDFIDAAKSAAPISQMREEIENIKFLLKQKDEAIEALKAELAKDKPAESQKKRSQKGEV